MVSRSLSLAFVVLLAGCPSSDDDDSSAVEPPTIDVATTDAVLGALEDAMPDLPAHGCTVALARGDGATWSAAAGLDGPGGDPLAPEDPFGIASITKTFTAGLVLELMDDGLVGLDDTLEEHVPGVHPRGGDITVRMLLTHTAGIPGVYGLSEVQADMDRAWTEDELFAIAAGAALLHEPGSSYSYSNTHYMLLARIAEVAGGAPWRQLMEEMLFNPLGLDATRIPPLGEGWGDVVPAWIGDTLYPVGALTHPQGIGAAGNMVSTALDVARWGQARFGGDLHSEQTNAAQLEGEVIGSGVSYGLGVLVFDTDEGGDVGHNGALGGFATWVGYRPDADLTLSLLCNAWGGGNPPDFSYPLPFAQGVLWEAIDE